MATHNILVIFGITGDLAQRKLLPALQHIVQQGHLENTEILGISRRDVTAQEVLAGMPDASLLKRKLRMLTMDIARSDDYERLRDELERMQLGASSQVLFYLSVPPQAAIPIVERLGKAQLNAAHMKVLLEKPFGIDLPTARESVRIIEEYFSEEQLYRIDHYLAKEMVQNLVTFRSHNALFRHIWSGGSIERVDIIASEKIGIESRAQFYEQTGALRDVLQNHLMQLASLVLMEVPVDIKTADIPRYRLQALQNILPIRPDTFTAYVRRGQYHGYDLEAGNPGSTTETFAAVTLFSSDPTWKDVPIRLATGKHLAVQTTEVRVFFKQSHSQESNKLVLHIQPKEGIEVDLIAKKPGYDKEYEQVSLSFDYAKDQRSVEAYERVIIDALSSDKSLFTTTDEVIRSWEILQPIQEHWAFHTDNLQDYTPGTSIDALLDTQA